MGAVANLSDATAGVVEKYSRWLRGVSRVLWVVFRVWEVVGLTAWGAVLYAALTGSDVLMGTIIGFFQTGLICVLSSVIAWAFSVVFREASTANHFSGKSIRALKIAAAAFLALFVFGSLASAALASMTPNGFSGWNIGYSLGGFPSWDAWHVVLGELELTHQSLNIATADITNLVFAFIAWGLSLVFAYGACLQEEKELVI